MGGERMQYWARVAVRVALGVAFLSAVADRFGLYGPPGSRGVGWGDWSHFVTYAGQLNWYLPGSLVPFVAVVATILEIVFGLALIAGYFVRPAALGSAVLLTLFGLGMATGLDITAPIDYSVFTAAAAAWLLAASTDEPGRS